MRRCAVEGDGNFESRATQEYLGKSLADGGLTVALKVRGRGERDVRAAQELNRRRLLDAC